MPLRGLSDVSGFVHQTGGKKTGPPLVYLPGVHGDWTAQGRARPILSRDFHLIETAYPRIETWSIDDFAAALKDLLDSLGIESTHLVGESFGSLVAWKFGIAHPERVRSFTLVGGFARPPRLGVAAAAASALRVIPTSMLESAIDLYVAGKSALGQQRDSFADLGAYPAARTERGQRAVANRMRIIQKTDFRDQLEMVRFPVRYVGGARDIVVPVRREIATLDTHLPPHCDFQSELVAGAPHTLIASHPEETAEYISRWARDADAKSGRTMESMDSPS